MKFTYLLGALAYGLCLEARRIPAPWAVARQWGDGDDDEGEEGGDGGGEAGDVCEWTDHCLGDPCETEIDCDGDLTCLAGSCANPDDIEPTPTVGTPTPIIITTTIYVTATPTVPPNPDCDWMGHCAGDPCQTENDCDGDMTCHSGTCGDGPVTLVTSTRRIVTSTRRVTVPPRPTTTSRVTVPPRPTTTRRGTVPPRPTTTSRVTVPPRPTTTRRVTISPTPRSTVRPPMTSDQATPRPPCADSPLACIGNSCETDADCGGSLIICKNGTCGL
ncbi:hypothetical protein F5144DRAFT_264461 [Chaetomium tenue]|uniref:Uncharacterized protein n=1 Tax=Chaetomium tenue TaxID=1854479 RepID=A0ACB7PCG7_9PEZI|nr:hypothetical protein F5144DRAFT_264461 [Chaetomium globosum]